MAELDIKELIEELVKKIAADEALKKNADRVICSNDYGILKYLLETDFQ